LTGESIEPAARIAGGTLFGGALGFVVSAVNAVVDGLSGKDIAGHLMALVTDSGKSSAALPKSASVESYRRAAENTSNANRFNHVDTIG